MKISVVLAFIILLCIPLAYAAMSPVAIPVCGHNPDSLSGFGEVKIWGFYFSCDNIADGVCPEDYQDALNPLIYGDCTSCTDPDCTGVLNGTVFDYNGMQIDKALITSHPIKFNQSAPSIETTTYSNPDGTYTLIAPTGKYSFSGAKDSYDTEIKEATVTRRGVAQLNFSLLNGTCHEDCTNSYNRCNPACDGLTFGGGSRSCNFPSQQIKSLCNNRLKGTEVFYSNINDSYSNFVNCCESSPTPRYYSKAHISSDKITDLVQIEKVGSLNGDPVRVIVAVFNLKP